jgi:hypothetical protein
MSGITNSPGSHIMMFWGNPGHPHHNASAWLTVHSLSLLPAVIFSDKPEIIMWSLGLLPGVIFSDGYEIIMWRFLSLSPGVIFSDGYEIIMWRFLSLSPVVIFSYKSEIIMWRFGPSTSDYIQWVRNHNVTIQSLSLVIFIWWWARNDNVTVRLLYTKSWCRVSSVRNHNVSPSFPHIGSFMIAATEYGSY